MDISTTISRFKKHLKAIGYAATTIDCYSKNLDLFIRYVQSIEVADLRKVTHQTICAYQSKVAAESVAAETKALKIRPVKRLFEHLVSTHKLLINPCDGIIETYRSRHKIGVVLTMGQVKAMMAQPSKSALIGIRDRAIMAVLYSTAIRLAELLGMCVHHVELVDKTLFVRRGKGNKQRVVPLGDTAVAHLRTYLAKVRPHYAKKNPKEKSLWFNQKGLTLSDFSVRDALRKYRLAAGIDRPVSPHTFRRSCATHLLQQGADIRYIQKLLGHVSLKTTQCYTKIMPVEVKKTHTKTHPGKKL